ncbi:MAG TPA: hypothetical protein PKD34_00730 [Candidatus Doudnabacteria bacterium]|mgnify:CR=1 FL=1|nr:hypothetical protein [Candidatus Doudnabacteria bacterium]
MSDPAKIKKLTDLVESSSILNPQEKSEWLALMQLMNDKQLSELEEILKPATPVSTSSVTTGQAESVNTPPLSHISNLPSQMVDPRIKARPLEMFHSPQSAKPVVKTPVQSPRVPEPRPQPRVQTPSPVIPKVQPVIRTEPVVSSPQKPPQTVTPKPTFNTEPVIPPNREQIKVPPVIQLSSLEEASTLTSAALHEQTREGFYKAIMGLAEQFGYFQVLSNFEQSSLYKDYIVYGKVRLDGGSDDNLPLSQEEFEFVADLLSALKINRI